MSILQISEANITTSEVDEIRLLVGDPSSTNLSINALSDVTISEDILTGQILIWNGSKFVNQTVNINTALQPGDNVSELVNDANYISTGDNVSELVNDAGYLTSETITLTTLKQVVADSTDFADFQSRIAAL